MKFMVSEKIFEDYPGLNIGVLVVKDCDNSGSPQEIGGMLDEVIGKVKTEINEANYKTHPKIVAWMEAHRKFGSKPKDYYPSISALVKRVVKGNSLPSINKLVDLYNYISLKYLIPVGGEDLDNCAGDIQLTYANGDEEFIEIGGTEPRPPEPGEVIYKDDKGVLCRRFNWREADRTKLTEDTGNAILVAEGLLPTTREQINEALSELESLVQKYCDASTTATILNKDKKELVI